MKEKKEQRKFKEKNVKKKKEKIKTFQSELKK